MAAGLPKAAGLVPPETIVLVEVPDFSQLRSQFEKTSLYKFYKDPAMKRFIESVKTDRREKISESKNAIVEAVFNAEVWPEGRAAFAMVLNSKALAAKEPTALFLIEWGGNVGKIKEKVTKAVNKAIEGGLRQKAEDYRGVNIKTIFSESSVRLGYGFSSKLSYCFIDDCLLGSEDIEILKFTIAHIKGASSGTLADDSDYNDSIGAVGPYHDIDIYVDIEQIIKMMVTEDAKGQARTIINNLGVDNVTAFASSIGLARYSGSSYCGKAVVKIKGPKKGICKMLETESATIKAPRFVPASTCSATFLNLNIKKAYAELGNILSSFSPMYAAMMYMPLLPPGADGEPGVQLKTGIIDYLGSEIVLAQQLKKPFSQDSMGQYLVALGVDDRVALERSLSLLHSKLIAPGNPDASRELLGHTIYLIEVPRLPFMPGAKVPLQAEGEAAAGGMPKIAFTITDTHLIFAAEEGVERAIRMLSSTGAASLGTTKWFNSAKVNLPSVVGLACLKDDAAAGELLWWAIKNGKPQTSAQLPFNQTVLGGITDPALLPEFEAVRKYFGFSTYYGISRSDGFFFEFRSTNPTVGN